MSTTHAGVAVLCGYGCSVISIVAGLWLAAVARQLWLLATGDASLVSKGVEKVHIAPQAFKRRFGEINIKRNPHTSQAENRTTHCHAKYCHQQAWTQHNAC
jgi:hypothetical protein